MDRKVYPNPRAQKARLLSGDTIHEDRLPVLVGGTVEEWEAAADLRSTFVTAWTLAMQKSALHFGPRFREYAALQERRNAMLTEILAQNRVEWWLSRMTYDLTTDDWRVDPVQAEPVREEALCAA